MPMKNNDIRTREELRMEMHMALKNNDTDGWYKAFDEMLLRVEEDVRNDYKDSVAQMRQEMDERVLSARGVRQLTSEERNYYQKVLTAMQSEDPKQALTGLDVVMPKTVIDSVMKDLSTNHPLLSRINFIDSNGAIRMLINEDGYQEAAWGALCDEIVKELTSGFKEVNTGLFKLSAFLPVCKAMLDLGPAWLDNYVRQVLYEALANGLERGIVKGTGKDMPVGMTRQVGEGVVVTGGVYPEKGKIAVADFAPETFGRLVGLLTVSPAGKFRAVNDLILIVNPMDYWQLVMPATTVQSPDGTFRNNILPVPATIIQCAALDVGEAILGTGKRYFAAAGMSKQGKIEYSDHYRFLEDERVYIIKTYANGMPMDNNAFLHLDITGLRTARWKVELTDAAAPSAVAELADLRVGALQLAPSFASATTTYSVATENAKNTINAVPAEAGAKIVVKVGNKVIENGTAATWATGENTVTVTVTAADGETTKTYTITVNAGATA